MIYKQKTVLEFMIFLPNFYNRTSLYNFFFLILLFSQPLLGQTKSKPKLEDELPYYQEEPKGNIPEEKIIVEGEDEQLIKPQKEESQTLTPKIAQPEEWPEINREIFKQEKRGSSQFEQKAQLKAEYGSYHYLGADIYVTKREEFGIYLIEFNRVKYDSEGFGLSTVGNSEFSSDKLNISSGFTLTESYKIFLKLAYLDFLRGLQQNPLFTQQFRRGGFFDFGQEIRPSEFQRLNVTISGEYIGSSIEENMPQRDRDTSFFRRVMGAFDWQYIFANRNALQISGNLWYGENQLYFRTPLQFYRAGDFFVKDVIPLFRGTVGESKLPHQMDLTLGVQVFFAQSMKPVWGPIFAIENFLGPWYSRLELERRGKIPEMREDFLERHYALPVHYSQNEEKWQAQLKNNIRLSKANLIKVNLGYVHYTRFWDRNFDNTTQMLSIRERLFRYAFGELSWEFSFGDIFYGETGFRGEYQQDKVTLRTPISFFTKTNFSPSSWNFWIESEFQGLRYIPDASVVLKPFFLLNSGIEKKFKSTLSVFLRGENLLNQRYILTYPYATSGLRLFGGLNIYF